MRTTYTAGAPWHAGTMLPTNVTGECPHEHRSPEAAQRCIDALDRSIKRGHGQHAHADRRVMVDHRDDNGARVGERHPYGGGRCDVCGIDTEVER